MKPIKKYNNFLISLLLNILLNIEGVIPALIFLILHFIFDWSILWFWIAFGIWLLIIIVSVCLLNLMSKLGSGVNEKKKENKNPYSAGMRNTIEIDSSGCKEIIIEEKIGDDENGGST